MSFLRICLIGSLLFLFCLLIGAPLALAQAPTDPAALMIVIDNSGSMDGTDPYDLRYAATRLILDVADEWDQIGVICFGDGPVEMIPLEALGATRDSKTQGTTKAGCPVAGGTNMSAAVNLAAQGLSNNQAPRQYILLLTDGLPNDWTATFTALQNAQQQGITTIPVALFPGQLDGNQQAFLQQLRDMQLKPQQAADANGLLAAFAEIYSTLKPDRYVAVLGAGGEPEIRVSALQQVNRMVFVLGPQQGIIENDASRSCANNAACKPDSGGQYELYIADEAPIEGIWRLPDPNQAAVVITRANFKPRLVFPPTDDEAQTGYFIGRGDKQTLIAGLEGQVGEDVPISLNGQGFLLSSGQVSYMINHLANEQTAAEVKLGTGDAPLVISKNFLLAPVPDPEPTLPRLQALNPNEQGQVDLENDTQFRLAVESLGDPNLTTRLAVYTLVFDTTTNEHVFGPEALQFSNGQYQSNQLLTLEPGIQYRVIFWLDAVRDRDGLRYGDQLDLSFALGGQIHVKGLTQLTFEDFQKGGLPLTIDVTERNRRVDLQARLTWNKQPPNADAGSYFTAQLVDPEFEGLDSKSTLRMSAPEDTCTLAEGDYEGVIELISSSGLPITPARVEVRDRIAYGEVKVLTNEAVDLGAFCRLPGALQFLCERVSGNEELLRPKIAIEVPSCVNERTIDIRLEDIKPPDSAQIEPGELDRSSTPIQLQILPSEIPPIALEISNFRNRQEFVGNLAIGREDQSERANLAQVRYTKYSLSDILAIWPLYEGPMRYGNLITTILTGFFGILTLWFTFGGGGEPKRRSSRRRREREQEDKQNGDRKRGRDQERTRRSDRNRERIGERGADSEGSRRGRDRERSRENGRNGRDRERRGTRGGSRRSSRNRRKSR